MPPVTLANWIGCDIQEVLMVDWLLEFVVLDESCWNIFT
jgi:hypothetical protein